MKTKKLALSGVLIALGVVLSGFYIPIGMSKCFPIQHLINVIGAVILGPLYAVINAFVISLIRNVFGLGSLLAFPGSMIGALLAGLIYEKYMNYRLTALFELIGTGIIGGGIAGPIAILLMGKEVGMLYFVIPFIISSFIGAAIALILLETTSLVKIVMKKRQEIHD